MSLEEPDISIKVNVKIDTRKFIPNPHGSIIGSNGQRGEYAPWISQGVHNLLTNVGRDFLHQQGYETTGLGTNGANYIALTTDSDAADATDTTLASEITTGGLARTQGTVAHTTGATATTVSNNFTATATHTSVQKAALLTASSSGIMVHEAKFTAITLANNDQIRVKWTLTIS